MTWDGAGSDCGVSVHLFDELEGRRLLCVKRSDQIHNRHRYRRYRIVGLLPAVVLVAGGLYLGLTNGSWIPLLAGVLFLLVSSLMIASDRTGSDSKKTKRSAFERIPHSPAV